jgi:hypothetical protein
MVPTNNHVNYLPCGHNPPEIPRLLRCECGRAGIGPNFSILKPHQKITEETQYLKENFGRSRFDFPTSRGTAKQAAEKPRKRFIPRTGLSRLKRGKRRGIPLFLGILRREIPRFTRNDSGKNIFPPPVKPSCTKFAGRKAVYFACSGCRTSFWTRQLVISPT